MAKRRKKKVERIVHLSLGPLPERLLLRFPEHGLLFTDASRLRHGGLAAILYRTAEAEPEIVTRSVPPIGSNELELHAAIFGLEQAARLLTGQRLAFFSDNQDAITRLARCKQLGVVQDEQLAALFPGRDIDALLQHATPNWIPGHGRCRGNALADQQARVAAGGEGVSNNEADIQHQVY
ncbi:MAG TPA: RNase H family protein [Azonexus sp.]|nr:RNase H family protein [Azonexus sp.]